MLIVTCEEGVAVSRYRDSISSITNLPLTAMAKLTLQQRRIRTIIWSVPIMVATSGQSFLSFHVHNSHHDLIVVLYKRHVLGEPQRKLPKALDEENRSIRLGDPEPRRRDKVDS